MKKISIFFLVSSLLLLPVHTTCILAQNTVDSLKNILPESKDTSRVNILNALANEIHYENPKDAIKLTEQALALSKKINYERGIADSNDLLGRSYYELNEFKKTIKYYLEASKYYSLIKDSLKLGSEYNEIGVVFKNQGEYQKALNYYNLSMDIFSSINNQKRKGYSLINIGEVYSYLGNYDKAIESYIKSIKIWEDIGDKKGLALAHGNLGNLYLSLRDHAKALEYYEVSEKLFRELQENFMLSIVLNNIGLIYNEFKETDKALNYYESAYTISSNLDYKTGMALSLSNMGIVYEDKKQLKKALENFTEALNLFRETGNKSYVAARLIDIGEVQTKLGDFNQALSNLTEGLEIAKEIEDAERELYSYKALFEYFETTKNYNQSLEFYKKYSSLKDSVFNIQKSEQITEIQTRYETEKKEQENELLRKEKAIREETISRKEVQNRMLLIGILFILSFAGYFYIVYRQKQRTNLLLSRQNHEINLKQQEIIEINASLQNSQSQLSLANEELQRLNSNLETTISERTSALEKSNVELDTFLYQSSHALRRPIVSIMGLVQVVRLESQQDQVDLIRNKIEDTAKKMDEMLRKLVMASEINISQFDQVKVISFDAILKETWEMLSQTFKTENICFKYSVEEFPEYLSKEVLIRILLQNILENAILYAKNSHHHETRINVLVKKQNNFLCIEVYDNGIGINSVIISRVFDMFTVATEKPKGFGLGLYIVKKAVEKLNGKIHVSSKDNEFTRFQILLPFKLKEGQA